MHTQTYCPRVIVADKIYTGFKPTRYVQSLVSLSGRIVYRGDLEKSLRFARSLADALDCREEVIEVDGVALPGFVDSHVHLAGTSMKKIGINLENINSIDKLLEVVSREAIRFKEWVYGRGWDQERLGRWPTRRDLDSAVKDKPVLLVRICGHVALANSLALEKLKLMEKEKELEEKKLIDYEKGLLFEEAATEAYYLVKKSIDPIELIVEGSKELARNGITTASDMGVDEISYIGYLNAYQKNLLYTRVKLYLSGKLFDELNMIGVVPSGGNELVQVVGVKVFADGSLGARTAWLRREYSDQPSTYGEKLLDWKRIVKLAHNVKKYGLDLAIHAIGDAAIYEVVKGCIESKCRCRIEHASVAPPDIIKEMARAKVRVSVQPRFIKSDYWVEERLGDRTRWVYPFRSFIEQGLDIGFSSDTPVEDPNPLEGIYYAVTRGDLSKISKNESLDVETSLYLYTRGSAKILGDNNIGCLEPGCYTDIVVLSHDPLRISIEEILSVEILATILGENIVYSKNIL